MVELLLIPKILNGDSRGFKTYLPDFFPDVDKTKIRDMLIVPHTIIRYIGNEDILKEFSKLRIESEIISRYNYRFIAKQLQVYNKYIDKLPYPVRNEIIKMNTKVKNALNTLDEFKNINIQFPYQIYKNANRLGNVKKLFGFGIRASGIGSDAYIVDVNLNQGDYILIDLRVRTKLKNTDYTSFVSSHQYLSPRIIEKDKTYEIDTLMSSEKLSQFTYKNIYSPLIKVVMEDNSKSIIEVYDNLYDKVMTEITESYNRGHVNFTWTGFLAHVEGEVTIDNINFIVLRIVTPLIVNNEFITSIGTAIMYKNRENHIMAKLMNILNKIKSIEDIKKSEIMDIVDSIIVVLPYSVKNNILRNGNGQTIIFTRSNFINKIKLPSTMSYRGRLRDDIHVHQKISLEEYIDANSFLITSRLKIYEENEGVYTTINIEPSYSIMDAIEYRILKNKPIYKYLEEEILKRITPSQDRELILRISYRHYTNEIFSERYNIVYDQENNVFEIITRSRWNSNDTR